MYIVHGAVTPNPSIDLCPLCGSGQKVRVVMESSLRYCRHCGVVFNTAHSPGGYDSSYFLDDYQRQYGKTYAEDFNWIYNRGLQRINDIITFSGKKEVKGLRLLDVGCALGFFLKAARDKGFDVEGIEISPYAVKYCKNTYGFTVHNLPFEEFYHHGSNFDVITAWYVIEHSITPVAVMRKIYTMLPSGGVMACAMPSLRGPMFHLHRDEWITTHPKDHYIDFSPGSITRVLKKMGFARVICVPASFHPERVCGKESVFYPAFSWMYKKVSKVFCFSDTMYIYALK